MNVPTVDRYRETTDCKLNYIIRLSVFGWCVPQLFWTCFRRTQANSENRRLTTSKQNANEKAHAKNSKFKKHKKTNEKATATKSEFKSKNNFSRVVFRFAFFSHLFRVFLLAMFSPFCLPAFISHVFCSFVPPFVRFLFVFVCCFSLLFVFAVVLLLLVHVFFVVNLLFFLLVVVFFFFF